MKFPRTGGLPPAALVITVVLFLLVSNPPSATAQPLTTRAKAFSFGVVPQFNASRIVKIWRPILDHLEKETGHRFKLIGSDNISAFEKEFSAGKFDFVYMNPYHFVHAERSQGYLPLVRDVGRKLFGIIVVPRDSPLQSVEELEGKVVAFPAPNALGASLMPRADFHNVYRINIRPRYVLSHSSVYLNVALGKADAGGGVQKTLQQQPEPLRNKLRIIHRTRSVVPHPIAAHPRVPASVRRQTQQSLLDMGSNDEGGKLLSAIPIHQIGQAAPQDYHPLLKLGLESLYQED